MKPLIDFLENFDPENPSWQNLPDGFPDCDADGLSGEQISKFNVARTLWKISQPEKKDQDTRAWNDPKGFERLAIWQNSSLLRALVRKFTSGLPRNEYRLKAQLDDAARSVKRNIEEGWKRPTTSEYLQFLGYSQGSLEEVKGDIRDAKNDGFLDSEPGSCLKNIGIDLGSFKGGQIKGSPEEKGHPYFEPLGKINYNNLTYEMLIELINKTDWLMRKTVSSLEAKLRKGKKSYEVEQAKIRSNLRFR